MYRMREIWLCCVIRQVIDDFLESRTVKYNFLKINFFRSTNQNFTLSNET